MTTNGYDLEDYDLTRMRSEKLITQHTKPKPKPSKPELRSKLDTHIHPERKQLEDFVSRQITVVLGKALKDSHEFIQDAMARVAAHLQDQFDDQLAIIKSKHDSDLAVLQNEIRKLKIKSKRGPRGPRGASPIPILSWLGTPGAASGGQELRRRRPQPVRRAASKRARRYRTAFCGPSESASG